MDIASYLEQMKSIHKSFLKYFGENEENVEEEYQTLIMNINNPEILSDPEELQLIIRLIVQLSNNHYRTFNFFQKIEKILQFIKKDITKNFTNSQIFDFFNTNKRLLLFIFEEEFITPDESIANTIKANSKFVNFHYLKYFYNELKTHLHNKTIQNKIGKEISKLNNYEEKRKRGENDQFICELIRQDNIEEFITYVNKNDISLLARIEESIFETNLFLLDKNPSLIKYSSFFGSSQIFNYLRLNESKIKSSLWIYSIHGQNPEIIHTLEEINIKPKDDSYRECFNESIKCHHNEIAMYIKDNYLQNQNDEIYSKSFKYINFICFPNNICNEFSFYYLCKYNYLSLVKYILKNKSIDINKKTVFHLYFIKFQKNIFK